MVTTAFWRPRHPHRRRPLSELRVGLLVGRRVRDVNGRMVGRIEDLHTEHHEGVLEVKTFLVGGTGLIARLDVPLVHNSILRVITWAYEKLKGGHPAGYAVSWRHMDLSDPLHPRTTVPREQLRERA